MRIEITVPDEAIDRIANAIKGEARQLAMRQGKDVQFKAEGAEFIREVLQAKIDNLFLVTDPEYIEAMTKARQIKKDAQKASLEKLKKSD